MRLRPGVVRARSPAATEIKISIRKTFFSRRTGNFAERQEFRNRVRHLSGNLHGVAEEEHDQDQREKKKQPACYRCLQEAHPRWVVVMI